MKHDSISKGLMETSLSASPQTELFHFICGTNGGKKMIFRSVHEKTATFCRVCSLVGAVNHSQGSTRPLKAPEKAEAVVFSS